MVVADKRVCDYCHSEIPTETDRLKSMFNDPHNPDAGIEKDICVRCRIELISPSEDDEE
jgi:hypothetical protein